MISFLIFIPSKNDMWNQIIILQQKYRIISLVLLEIGIPTIFIINTMKKRFVTANMIINYIIRKFFQYFSCRIKRHKLRIYFTGYIINISYKKRISIRPRITDKIKD